jgi:hydrogenase maturation protease
MDGTLVILGVGNLLMSDDGVGIHAVRELAQNPPLGICVADVGTDFLSALPYMESARRVLVLDAVKGRGAPGSIYRLESEDIELRAAGGSAHATSVLEARRFLPSDAAWPEITVLGVEPFRLECGMTLSAPVARALPRLVALAREIVSSWQNRLQKPQGTLRKGTRPTAGGIHQYGDLQDVGPVPPLGGLVQASHCSNATHQVAS